ncbi:MAG: hypothetical protein ACRDSK_18370 [Actinophytocola sp.]|uniref:hypothetical protein n=1 Tax=Actinophytocola sp. TaxID=1872138 RepID=UPI003D6BC932
MTRVLLASRSAQWVLLAAVAMWALAVAIGRRALEIDLSATFPPTKPAVVELCGVVTATLLAILTRPRFWEWDRIARGARPRAVAAAVAASVIGLSALCVPAVVPWLPAGASWTWVLANVLALGATVLLLTPLCNPLLAGAVTVVAWFAAAVTANLAPGVWLPLADYGVQSGRWAVAGALVVTAVLVHAGTCGKTSWAHRQFDAER